MRNYIRADVKRILGRTSHTLSMLLLFGIFFCSLYFPNSSSQNTSVSLITSAIGTLDMLLLFVGLFELIAVFSEDFKVKTMQVAIGLGISRTKVVLCKLLEAVILITLDCIVLLLLTLGIGALLDVSVPMNVLMDLIRTLAVNGILASTCYTSLTMIVMFVTQSTVLSIFVYLLVGIDIINLLLSIAPMLGFDWLEKFRLTHITLSYQISVFSSRLALGTFDFLHLLGIAVYMGLGIFFTCRLFSKHELDF